MGAIITSISLNAFEEAFEIYDVGLLVSQFEFLYHYVSRPIDDECRRNFIKPVQQ